MNYGTIVEAKITDKNDKKVYAQYQGTTFEIIPDPHDQEQDFELGQVLEGMIYEGKDGGKYLQLDLPDIRPGYYGWGIVTASRKDLGVFVDVGLVEKDVVLSLDDLPEDRQLWPRKEDKLYVTYEVDSKQRMWAKLADQEKIQGLMKKAPSRLMNQVIKAQVYLHKGVGVLALSEEGYRIFIHESQMFQMPRLGQALEVRIIKVAPDGTLNGSLKPRAHEALDDDATMIKQLLDKKPDGFLPFHDKSDPQVIQEKFGISKAQFKRALGVLMKAGYIRQEKDKGIYKIHAWWLYWRFQAVFTDR